MSRYVGYAESLGSSNTSSATYSTKVSLTVPTVSGKKYLLLWSCSFGGTATFGAPDARLRNVTDGITYQRSAWFPKEASTPPDSAGQGGAWVYEADATENIDFAIQYSQWDAGGSNTIKQARLLVLELGALDEVITDDTWTATDNGSRVALQLDWTPPTTGDYALIASCVNEDSPTLVDAGERARIQLRTPATTEVDMDEQGLWGTGATGVSATWNAIWVESVASGATRTAQIRPTSDGSSAILLKGLCLVALRLDDLENVQYAQDITAQGDASTSYVTTNTLAATGLDPVARDTILIAAAAYKAGSTTVSSYLEIREETTQLLESVHESQNTAADIVSPLLAMKVSTNASALDFDFRHKSETAVATTTIYSTLLLFEVEQAAVYEEAATVAMTLTCAQVVTNTLGVAATFAASVGVASAKDYVAGVAVSFPLTLDENWETLATLEPTLGMGITLSTSQAALLSIELSATYGLSVELAQLGGILYGASVQFDFLLTTFVIPSSSYEQTLTLALEFVLANADNLGAIELGTDFIFELDNAFERGRVWEETLPFFVGLDLVIGVGNVLGLAVDLNLSLVLETSGSRGVLESTFALGVLTEVFAASQSQITVTGAWILEINADLTVAGNLQPSIVLNTALGYVGLAAKTVDVSLLLSTQLGVGLVGGLMLDRGFSLGVRAGISAAIIDFDFLVEVSDVVDLDFFATFENWFSRRQGGTTAFVAGGGEATAFTQKAPSVGGGWQLRDNFEDPDFQFGNPSGGQS